MSENNGDPAALQDMLPEFVHTQPTLPVSREESGGTGGTKLSLSGIKSYFDEWSLPSVFRQQRQVQLEDNREHFDFRSEEFRELAKQPKAILREFRKRTFPKKKLEGKESLALYERNLEKAHERFDVSLTKHRSVMQEKLALEKVMKKAAEDARAANADIDNTNHELLTLDLQDRTAEMIINEDVVFLSDATSDEALAYGGLSNEDGWKAHPDKISSKVQMMMNAGWQASPHCPKPNMRIFRSKGRNFGVIQGHVKAKRGISVPKILPCLRRSCLVRALRRFYRCQVCNLFRLGISTP